MDTSHLTVLSKQGKLSSHITSQERPEDRRYFPSISMKEIAEAAQKAIRENLISSLTDKHLSEQVLYITQRFVDWYESVKAILYEERISPREVIHIINLKRIIEKMSELIDKLRESPSSFFGLCQAKEILEDNSKVLGFTKTKTIVIPCEGELFFVDFSLIMVSGNKKVIESLLASA